MGWKMVYNSLDKNRENREKMLLTFAKNSIRSKPPPSFRAMYHNKNHVITNTVKKNPTSGLGGDAITRNVYSRTDRRTPKSSQTIRKAPLDYVQQS